MLEIPRPCILLLTDCYLPGWRAGGPTRSQANLVAALGDRFDFRVFTRDRDLGDPAPYPQLTHSTWLAVGKAQVFYAPPRKTGFLGLARVTRSIRPELVITDGFFSRLTIKYLLLRRLHCMPRARVLVVVAGQFGPDAIAHHAIRKKAYSRFARATGLLTGCEWQASTPAEAAHIASVLRRRQVHIVPDLPDPPPATVLAPPAKEPGSVALVFLSRISPVKNLPFLVGLLAQLRGEIRLTVFGPRELDEWERVKRAAQSLPTNVRVIDNGAIEHDKVDQALAGAHFFVLPTLGENFGHAIYEALAAGRPVIISDRTPWRKLSQEGAGWDLPLEQPAAWVAALQECVDANDSDYARMSHAARSYAQRWFTDNANPETQAAVIGTMLSRRE